MLLERALGSISNRIPKFLTLSRRSKRRVEQFEKRHKREGLLREVFAPEDRILLSGVTVSDDTVVVQHKNAAVAIDVLANDSTAGGANLYVLSATQASFGSVSLVWNAQGQQRLVYTASNDFVGTDSFTYYAMDDYGQSASATVSFTIALPNVNTTNSGGLVPRMQLSTGFTPDGNQAFDHVARGNFEMIVGGTSVQTEWLTSDDGQQRAVTTTTSKAFSIVNTESSNGTWGYNETLVGTSSSQLSAGGGSIGVSSSESFGFNFAASGNGSTVSYLMNLNGTGQGAGDTQGAGSGSGAPGGSSAGSPGNSGGSGSSGFSSGSSHMTGFGSQASFSASIQNTTNLSTGASSGSVVGSGSNSADIGMLKYSYGRAKIIHVFHQPDRSIYIYEIIVRKLFALELRHQIIHHAKVGS